MTSNCVTTDCFEIATIERNGMRLCRPCDYLIDHPEIDEPSEIEKVYAALS